MNKILETFRGKKFSVPPVWFMRQAGRYLPEYHELRRQATDFMDFCARPDLTTEATLQPLRRFDLDAAIIFADILLIPHALGQKVWFEPGEGPRLALLEDISAFLVRKDDLFAERLAPTLTALSQVRQKLSPDKALIGFAGAPWTVMAYMIQGQGSKSFDRLIAFASQQPTLFQRLCDHVTQATEDYLKAQIQAGAQVLQLFDSWAGLCPASLRQTALFEPVHRLVSAVRSSYPDVPIIAFAKGLGKDLVSYGQFVEPSGLGLGGEVEPTWAKDSLSFCNVLQGGPSPEIVREGGEALTSSVQTYLDLFQDRPYIFNLAHGILPDTPIKHIERVLECLKERGGESQSRAAG